MSADLTLGPRSQATMELLFFASIGDASRCETICELWDIDVRDRGCCDYDKRTPLCVLSMSCLDIVLSSEFDFRRAAAACHDRMYS